jgi:flagellar motor protein MotB
MRKRGKAFVLTILGLVFLYALVGFVVIPWVITTQLPPKLSKQVDRAVFIQEARFNPFLFKLQVERFDIQEQDGSPLLGFDELFIDFEVIDSLVNQAYTFKQIRLGLPYGLAIVRPDGSLNFQELAQALASPEDQAESPPTDRKESEGLPPVLIEKLAIQQGMVEFRDYARPTPFVAHLVPINLTLEQFSTQQGLANAYVLSAQRGAGENMSWEGTVTLEPFQSEGRLALENFILPELWDYVQDQFRFQIPQGQVTVNGHYLLSTTDQGVEVLMDGGNLRVRELQIQEKGAPVPVVSLPLFEVTDASVDVARRDVNISVVKGRDARFTGWVGKDGIMNYQSLFAPVDAESQAEKEPESSSTSSNPWKVVIEDLAFDNFTIEFEDRQPDNPVTWLLDELHLHTANVSLDLNRPLPVDLSFQLNQTGKADVRGTLAVDPLTVEADVSLIDITLKPFQSYAAPFVQFDVENGALTLQGKMNFQQDSSVNPMVTFQGGMEISQLTLNDPMQDQSFLKWERLGLKELDLQIEPSSVNLQELELVDPFILFLIDTDGGINFSRLLSPPGSQLEEETSQEGKGEEAENEGGPPTPVNVASVNISDLLARFADLSVTPNVVTQIEGLTGTIKGLSSDQLAKADVDLEGRVDNHALLTIAGQINPLSEEAYTDLTVSVKDLSLPTVSPYSGKYAGYPITKGKLSLDLAYNISETVLKGENKLLIDQLTMGKKVESPEAISLPIPLALALLKDRNGQIDINLPVRGNLDDPDFSYGGIIWNALVNLLTKIVTSPFAMVGGLLGVSGEDLRFIAFPAGKAQLSQAEQDKLQAIGKALDDRPLLRLEITGAADPQADRQALAAGQLRKQLQKRKFVQGSSSASKGVSVEQIELNPAEEARLLSELYVEKFVIQPQTPSTSEGKTLDPPTPQQMQSKLVETIQVKDEQLRLLANERAQAIRDYLIQEGKVSGDRVFLVEPNLDPETGEETIRSPLSLTAG